MSPVFLLSIQSCLEKDWLFINVEKKNHTLKKSHNKKITFTNLWNNLFSKKIYFFVRNGKNIFLKVFLILIFLVTNQTMIKVAVNMNKAINKMVYNIFSIL